MLHLLCRLWFVRQPPLSKTGVIITGLDRSLRSVGLIKRQLATV